MLFEVARPLSVPVSRSFEARREIIKAAVKLLKADANGSGNLGSPARHPTQRGLSLSAYQHDDRQDERHLDFRLAHF